MSGTFVSLSGNTITVNDNGGAQKTLTVDANAKVTLNGKAGKLDDLKPGDKLSLSGDPVTTINASR